MARRRIDFRVGAGEDDQEVGLVGVGAPVLGTGDLPVVAHAHGAAGDVGNIRAGIRLGQRIGAEKLALRHARQQLGLALRRQRVHRAQQAVAARDQAGDAHPAAREFLGDQAVLEGAQPEAAEFFGDQDAEVAEFGHFLDQFARDRALVRVQLVGQRQHPLHREFARRLLDEPAFVGQYLHGSSSRIGVMRRRARRAAAQSLAG